MQQESTVPTDQIYTVYCHRNHLNDKRYIGQTHKTMEQRSGINGSCYKKQRRFSNAINKYGWENFDHTILADGLTKDEANIVEQFYIWRYNTTDTAHGYNIAANAEYTPAMRDGSIDYWSDPANRKLRSEMFKRRHLEDKSFHDKITESNRAKWQKPTAEKSKEKIRNTLAEYWNQPGLKEQAAKNSKAAWEDPTYRENHCKKVKCVETGIIYESATLAAKDVGLKSSSSISDCLHGKQKTAKGFHWVEV